MMNRSLTGVFFGGGLMFEPQRCRPLVDRLLQDVASGKPRVVIDRTYPLARPPRRTGTSKVAKRSAAS